MTIGLIIQLLKNQSTKIISMKKIIVLSFLLAFTAYSYGQQSAPKQHLTDTEYYKKSRKQKTCAWVSTGVGASILLVTLFADALSTAVTLGQGKATGTTAPYLIGAACVTTGVVLFVASGKNRKKANAVSAFINMEKAQVLQRTLIRNHSFSAIGLKISL